MKKGIIVFAGCIFVLAIITVLEPVNKAVRLYNKVTEKFADDGETIYKVGNKIEQRAVNDYNNGTDTMPKLSDKEADKLSLGEVTVSDLVLGTYFPFGEETEEKDKDEFDRFREITIITPAKEWWDIHPSDEEVAEYRSNLISEWEAAKEAAYKEALKNATPTPAPTKAPTVSVTPAATPKPTATPMPTPVPDFSLTASELEEVEKEVSEWYEENSYIEERDTTTSIKFYGEDVRAYVNSYHPEWQVAYSLSLLMEFFHDEYEGGDEMQISAEVANDACARLTEDYKFELMLDYWSEEWGDKWSEDGRTLTLEEEDLWTSYENKVSGGTESLQMYDEYEADYTNNRLKDEPDLRKVEWIEPFVLFRSVNAWSENLTFTGRTGLECNEYGFYQQDINSKDVGSIFLEIVSIYDFPKSELMMMQDVIDALPESYVASSKWSFAMDQMGGRSGYLVDRSTITWLTGSDIGAAVSRLALEQVGAIYSNEYRNKKGYFDCSSLTHFLYATYGINIAMGGDDVAAAQCNWCDSKGKTLWTYYNEAEMIPGDLIFWQTYDKKHAAYPRYKHVYHVGVYIGNGMIVDASTAAGCVVCRKMWGVEKVVGVARPYE